MNVEKHLATPVIGLDPHLAAEAGNANRRIDDRRIPARIAARIFIVGRKNRAAPLVELVDIAGNRIVIGHLTALARDRHAAPGFILLRTVFQNTRIHDFLL